MSRLSLFNASLLVGPLKWAPSSSLHCIYIDVFFCGKFTRLVMCNYTTPHTAIMENRDLQFQYNHVSENRGTQPKWRGKIPVHPPEVFLSYVTVSWTCFDSATASCCTANSPWWDARAWIHGTLRIKGCQKKQKSKSYHPMRYDITSWWKVWQRRCAVQSGDKLEKM